MRGSIVSQRTPQHGDQSISAEFLQALQWVVSFIRRGITCAGGLQATVSSTGITMSQGPAYPTVYEATADESGGEITIRPIKQDTTIVGATLTVKTLAASGQGEASSSSS